MRKARLLLLAVLGCVCSAFAQGPTGNIPSNTYQTLPSSSPQSHGTGAPTATCSSGNLYTNDSNGTVYSCNAGTWQSVGGAQANSPGIPTNNGNVYYPTNYGAKFDALNLLSCSGSGSPGTVTCTGTGTNFIATDVGKTIWESGNGNTTADLPPTTITAVNSTTQVAVAGNFTRSTASGGEAVYGHDDSTITGTPFLTIWNAILALQNCNGSVRLPAGNTIISKAILNQNLPANCVYDQTSNMPTISGEGTGSTIIYWSPSFVYGTTANCTSTGGYCIGAGQVIKRDFTVAGGYGGNIFGSNTYNGCVLGVITPASIQNITLYDFYITGNAQAVCAPSGGAWLYNVDVYGGTGTGSGATCTGLSISGSAITIFNSYVVSDCAETPGAAMQFSGGADAIYTSYGVTSQLNAIAVTGGSTLFNQMDSTLGITVSGASTIAWINNSSIPTAASNLTCNLNVTTGANVYLFGSNLKNTSGTGTNYSACVDATSTITDEGGNQLSANTAPVNMTAGGTWSASGGPAGTINISAQLSGASACVASQTLFLFPYGQTATSTCSSATAETQIGGYVAPRAGTLEYLNISLGTGGIAGDAVTVLKNGATTALTCTFGTGTSCSDVTHTVAVAAQDLIGFQITTGAAETAKTPKASVILF